MPQLGDLEQKPDSKKVKEATNIGNFGKKLVEMSIGRK
jgi:hypothetical protein